MVDTNGIITTIAGIGVAGFSGDGGQAARAVLNSPQGLATDLAGNLYVADSGNNRLRVLSAAGSPVLTVDHATSANAGAYQVVINNPWAGTTSTVVTLNVLSTPPKMNVPIYKHQDGTLTLNGTGTPNGPYQLCVADWLTAPIVWTPIATNLASAGGQWQFIVTVPPGARNGFYQVVGQ